MPTLPLLSILTRSVAGYPEAPVPVSNANAPPELPTVVVIARIEARVRFKLANWIPISSPTTSALLLIKVKTGSAVAAPV